MKRKLSGRAARAKGLNFERWVAGRLRHIFPFVRRQMENQIEDANGVDLQETGLLRFQCKKLRKYAPLTTIEEIKCERLFGEIPVLVTAGDGAPVLVAMHFDDFVRLLDKSMPMKELL